MSRRTRLVEGEGGEGIGGGGEGDGNPLLTRLISEDGGGGDGDGGRIGAVATPGRAMAAAGRATAAVARGARATAVAGWAMVVVVVRVGAVAGGSVGGTAVSTSFGGRRQLGTCYPSVGRELASSSCHRVLCSSSLAIRCNVSV